MTTYSELAPICTKSEESAYAGREKASEDMFSIQSKPSPNTSGHLQISRKETRRLRRATRLELSSERLAFFACGEAKSLEKHEAPQ
jgi:hypothetical protein